MQKAVIAIHGGAGSVCHEKRDSAQEQRYVQQLSTIVKTGQKILAEGGSALDAVSEAVRLLEECPLFNAGIGSVLTRDGTHELDACIMDGNLLKAGAVACVSRLRNPILAARLIMEQSPHVLLVGEGAERFAADCGMPWIEPSLFSTAERKRQWQQAQGTVLFGISTGEPLIPDSKFGTVGAVALDLHGNLAAATSSGGLTNKIPGRVGDSPLPGAGCYANNANAAVSCTGTGDIFIRTLAAYDIAALMEYGGLSLQQACERVVMEKLPALGGQGGVIAVDNQGNLAMPFNCEGMYRAFAWVGDAPNVGIYQ